MHLINIHTKELEEFIQSEVPSYAILSHRWGLPAEELTFKEVSKKRIDRQKPGYSKLAEACRVAADYEVSYLWNDTCCIDKKSSAELSEAINSMYSWYGGAKICMAYLNDVRAGENLEKEFTRSVWFTRAWTLQELIAPKDLAFFDCNWKHIGTKKSRAIIVKKVTGIPDKVLRDPSALLSVNIRGKMSWASDRNATRPEDIAYSLMGIFNINMPLLYGEGTKAFARLQEEIIRRATEPSFLFWRHSIKPISPITITNLLASSPADFRSTQEEAWFDDSSNGSSLKSIPMAPLLYLNTGRIALGLKNIGLEIDAMLVRYKLGIYGVVVGVGSSAPETVYVILIKRPPGQVEFYRIGTVQTIHFHRDEPFQLKCRKITILRDYKDRLQASTDANCGFDIQTDSSFLISPRSSGFIASNSVVWRENTDSTSLTCTFLKPLYKQVARMACKVSELCTLGLHLSFDFDSRPCLLIMASVAAMEVRQDSYRASVFKISDTVDKPLRTSGYDYAWIYSHEIQLHEVLEDGGPKPYFFRAEDQSVVSARLPSELVGTENMVWMSFTPLDRHMNNSNPWLFAITSTRPGLHTSPENLAESELTTISTGACHNYYSSASSTSSGESSPIGMSRSMLNDLM
jgi:hypothetical protein